jgi:hypothetical protein
MTMRDLLVLAGTVFWEPSSLPALWRLAGCMRRAWRQRRLIMGRRKVSDEAMAQWFSFEPAAQPIHQTPASHPARHLLAPAVTLAGRTT